MVSLYDEDNPFVDSPFIYSEYNIALRNKKPEAAVGSDGIDYVIL